MTEWEVVSVIVVLIGLVVSIATPILKLNSTIVKLNTTINIIMDNLEAFKKRYTETLAELRHTDEAQETKLENHEHRITVLENKKE